MVSRVFKYCSQAWSLYSEENLEVKENLTELLYKELQEENWVEGYLPTIIGLDSIHYQQVYLDCACNIRFG